MSKFEYDAATTDLCGSRPAVAVWSYTLDTSGDDAYPFISYGQLLLREDGAVFQRVHHSLPNKHGPWSEAPRAQFGGPYSVADVERMFTPWDTDYTIARMDLPHDGSYREVDGFPAD